MAKPHEFAALFPVPLEPLNVPGAYTTAALPPEVDPALASLWRRLGVRLPTGAKRIIPHVAHGRVGRKGPALSLDTSSPNWSGCVVNAQSGAPAFPVIERQAAGHVDGYATPTNAQQHVNYIDDQGNVIELLFRSDWAVNNLTSLAVPTPPPAELGSAIAGYITTAPDQQHVIFVGQDAQVHELMFDGSWHHTNLCVASGHPILTVLTASTSLPLAAYVTSFNEQQHVIFLGTDGRPYEFVYKSSTWQLTDLLGSATPALPVTVASDTPLVGYQTSWNGQHHVLFVGTTPTSGRHVYELMFDTVWHLNDLTGTATGAPQEVISGGSLCGYVTSADTQQHVDYVGVDGLVHELLYVPGAAHWRDTDLIGAANAETKLLVAAKTSLAGYETPWNGQQHVCFVGIEEGSTTNSVFELMYPSGGTWTFNNLTSTVSGTPPLLASPLDGYITVTVAATGAYFQQHVNFIGIDGALYELYYDGSWHENDLSSAAIARWEHATGYWTIPTVGPTTQGHDLRGGWVSSSWIGLDGTNESNALLQAGINQNVAADGTATYLAWWEWYAPSPWYDPNSETVISNFPVSPGDLIQCSVSYIKGDTAGFIWLVNVTTNQYFSIVLEPPSGAAFFGNSAEWIMEVTGYRPLLGSDYAEPGDTYPAFSPVVFQDAMALDVFGKSGIPGEIGYITTVNRLNVPLTSTYLDRTTVTIVFLSWQLNNLELPTSSAAPLPSALAGYTTSFGGHNQQHVNYIGVSAAGTGAFTVRELMFDTAWHANDLLQSAGATSSFSVIPSMPVVGYATPFNGQQHVIFVAIDSANDVPPGYHICELLFTSTWKANDLTSLARTTSPSVPAVQPGGGVAGYVTTFNRQEHIIYVGTDGQVHELVYDGQWRDNPLFEKAGLTGVTVAGNTPLIGFQTTYDQREHVVFIGSSTGSAGLELFELSYDSQWTWQNITNGVPLAVGTALAGYETAYNSASSAESVGEPIGFG